MIGRLVYLRLPLTASCLLVALSVVPAPGQTADSTPARLTTSLTAITGGDGSAGRRNAIVTALQAMGATYELQSFGNGADAGTNIVVPMPGAGTASILVGAHYDRVAVGQGAVDNGASCAVLLDLIGRLKATPLTSAAVTFVFFDLEERGLLGARAYLAALKTKPTYAINLDIFAYGDVFMATASRPDGVLLRELRTAAAAATIPISDLPMGRYPGSDHQAMAAAGIETLGVALLTAEEVAMISGTGGRNLQLGSGPRVLTIIHSARDTVAEVRPDDMAKAIPVLEQWLRAFARPPAPPR
jgi:Zn-dependent M28 family amino/carboxypeptidase